MVLSDYDIIHIQKSKVINIKLYYFILIILNNRKNFINLV